MAAGQKAFGSMVLGLDVNTAKAFSSVNSLKANVRELNSEWMGQYNSLRANGEAQEALKVKSEGLTRVLAQQKVVQDQINDIMKNSQNLTGVNQIKLNRLNAEQQKSVNMQQKQQAELDRTNRLLTLHSAQVQKTTELTRATNAVTDARVDRLKAEGREYDVTKAKMEGYREKISATRTQIVEQARSLEQFRQTSKMMGADYSKDSDYLAQVAKLEKTKTAYADLQREMEIYSTGIVEAGTKNKAYSAGTAALVERLKAEKHEFTAGAVELSRLKKQRKLDLDLYNAQAQKANIIAQRSGKESTAYQKESTQLNKLGKTYAEHSTRLNKVGKAYGGMSAKTALSFEKMQHQTNKWNSTGNKFVRVAGTMKTATVGVGAAFLYGAKTATTLENTYKKVNNLLVTGGEEQAEVTKNVNQMQKDGRKYSIEYGESMTNIADGYEELVKRGYSSKQAVGAMRSELQASVASGDDFKDVVSVASQTLESFGMRAKSTAEMTYNTKRAVNALAYSADMTATDFHGIGKGMEYVGATAHNMHFSLSETSAALGVLSNNGLEADKAGTGLRKTLISLASPSKAAWGALGQIGIKTQKQFNETFKDTKGNFKSMSDILGTAWEKSKSMSSSDRGAFFKNLFGTTGMQAAQILAKNSDELGKLTGKVQKASKSGKYVQNLANKNAQTTQMALKKFKQAGTELAESFARTLLPSITGVTKQLAGAFNLISKMPKSLQVGVAAVGLGIPAITALGFAVGGTIKSVATLRTGWMSFTKMLSPFKFKEVSTSIGEETLAYNEQTAAIETQNKVLMENNSLKNGGTGTGKRRTKGQNVYSNSTNGIDPTDLIQTTEKGVGSTAHDAKEAKTLEAAATQGGVKGWSNGWLAKIGGTLRNTTVKGVAKGGLKAAGKGVGLGALMSLTNLIGINKKNASEKLSATGGSLIGGGIGGLAGSVLGPGGTAIGATIGSSIGEAGGKSIKKDVVDPFVKAFKQGYGGKKSPKKNKTPKRGTKDDSKIASTVTQNSKSLTKSLTTKTGGAKMLSEKQFKSDRQLLKDNTKAINDYYDNKYKKSKRDLDQLKKSGVISKSQYNSELKELKSSNKKRKSEAESNNKSLEKILTNYHSKVQTDTKTWNNKIYQDELIYGKKSNQVAKDRANKKKALAKDANKYTDQMLKAESKANNSLSKSIKKATGTQVDLYKSLRKNIKTNSAQQTKDVLNAAKKQEKAAVSSADSQRKKVVSAAQAKYKKTKALAQKEYKENSGFSKKDMKAAIAAAKKKKTNTINSANQTEKQILKAAQKTYDKTSKLATKQADHEISQANKAFEKTKSKAQKKRDAQIKIAKSQNKGASDEAKLQRKMAIAEANTTYKKTVDKAEDARADTVDKYKKQKEKVAYYAEKQRQKVDKETTKTKEAIEKKNKQMNSSTDTWWGKITSTVGKWLGKTAKKENKNIKSNNTMFNSYGASGDIIAPLPETYATGTGLSSGFRKAINKPTYAMLNDGHDSPETNNREIAMLPNGQMFAPEQRNWTGVLPAGTEVMNATESKLFSRMLGLEHFATGTGIGGFFGSITKWVSKAFGSLKDKLAAAIGISANPTKTFNATNKSDNTGLKGIYAKTLNKAVHNKKTSFAKSWFAEAWNQINNAANSGGAGGNWGSPGAGLSTGANGQNFGDSRSFNGKPGTHDGRDWGGALGTAIHAIHGGQVIKIGGVGIPDLGDVIIVKSDDGFDEIYQEFGNMRNIKVSEGDTVKTGQRIATMGRLNGSGTGNHVHIGVTKGNPLSKNMTTTAGWFDPAKMHGSSNGNKKNAHKANSALSGLVKGQLKSKGVLSWVKKFLAPLNESDDGIGTSAAPSGSHKHWLEQAGIPKSWYNSITEIINKESGWRTSASNGKYQGIPQTTVGNLRAAGSDWRTNPITQLKAMKTYIKNRYGSADKALSFRRAHNWYENGGLVTKHQIAHIGEGNKPEMVIPLTNKSRAFKLIMDSLSFLMGSDSIRGTNKTQSSSVDQKLLKSLVKENKKKDKMLDEMLDKMDILINTITNLQTGITPAQIYRANKQYSKQKSNLNALNRGEFNL